MFNLHITLTMAIVGLTDIVNRYGADHIGNLPAGGCAYVERAQGVRLIPSCIVGVFFSDLGILRVLVDAEVFCGLAVEGSEGLLRNAGPMAPELRNRLGAFGITLSDDAYAFLMTAQNEQDGANQWGQSVEVAARQILANRGEPTTALALLALHEEVANG
jgi:hypothetical protein